jgi:hypothetical protein
MRPFGSGSNGDRDRGCAVAGRPGGPVRACVGAERERAHAPFAVHQHRLCWGGGGAKGDGNRTDGAGAARGFGRAFPGRGRGYGYPARSRALVFARGYRCRHDTLACTGRSRGETRAGPQASLYVCLDPAGTNETVWQENRKLRCSIEGQLLPVAEDGPRVFVSVLYRALRPPAVSLLFSVQDNTVVVYERDGQFGPARFSNHGYVRIKHRIFQPWLQHMYFLITLSCPHKS